MPSNEILERYNAKANTIIEHYNALTNVVGATLFPWKFIASSTLPDSTHWSQTRKVMMMFIMPLSIFDRLFDKPDGTQGSRLFFLALWMLIYVFYYGFGLASLIVSSQVRDATSSTSDQTSSMNTYVAWSLIVLFVVIAFLIYWQVLWYLFNKKTSWKNRSIWIGSFLLLAYVNYLVMLETVPNLFVLLSSGDFARTILLYTIVVFWVPSTMMTVSLLLIFGRLVLYVILSMLIYFINANSPNYSLVVRTILLKPIGASENANIFSLAISEIIALRKWAQLNLDTTEKRTIPAIIFLAILGAVATFSKVQDIFYNSLTAFVNLLNRVLDNFLKSPQDFVAYLATFTTTAITLLIILFIIMIYTRLLSNLFIQGVVIEVCTVAEFAKEEVDREIETLNKDNQSPWSHKLLRWLLGKRN
jgi:hypothetical protein